ncbi:hypothetical protein LCGC14_2267320, partial [marine sediment metagenome]
RSLYSLIFTIEKKLLLLQNRLKYGKLYFNKIYWVNPKKIQYISKIRVNNWYYYSRILEGDWDHLTIPFEDTSDLFWLSVYVSDIAKTKKEVINKIWEYLSVNKKFGIEEKKRSVLSDEIINYSEETSKLFVKFINETTRNMELVSKRHISTKNIISINLKKLYLRIRNIVGWIIGKYIKKRGYCIKYEGVSKKEVKTKFGLLKHCKICGYSKHVVTCHIKEISSFNKQTLIKKVNNVSNITGLCSNHHWEMDHNLLSKEDKEKLQPNPAT